MVSDLNKNFGGSTDLAKKRHGSADLHTPIKPPHLLKSVVLTRSSQSFSAFQNHRAKQTLHY